VLERWRRALDLDGKIRNGKSASVEHGVTAWGASNVRLRSFRSERVAAELFRMLDVEKMVDERGFEPPASSLRTRKNLR